MMTVLDEGIIMRTIVVAVFSLWSQRPGDGLSIQEDLRVEWQRWPDVTA